MNDLWLIPYLVVSGTVGCRLLWTLAKSLMSPGYNLPVVPVDDGIIVSGDDYQGMV